MDRASLIVMGLKYLAGGILIGLLFALAWTGKYAENGAFVSLVTVTLGGLGVHLITPGTQEQPK